MRLPMSCLLAAMFAVVAPSAYATGPVDCKPHFSMSGWSAFYKTLSGWHGQLRQRPAHGGVDPQQRAAGLTFGKTCIENGVGEFSGVRDIHDVLGHYAAAGGARGAGKSGARAGGDQGRHLGWRCRQGRGLDLGVAFGNFIISAR